MRGRAACLLSIPLLAGCGPAREVTTTLPAPPPPVTAETLVEEGKRLYAARELDSASAAFAGALRLDSTCRPALQEMARLQYDIAMGEQGKSGRRVRASRNARDAYIRLERQGVSESDIYERICELSVVLEDHGTFLRYAKKNAEKYPFDRQYYNLGVAYVAAEDYAGAIKTLKEATEKFPSSMYIGGFYRQLGRAYAGVDRDQTAERTYTAGLKAVEQRLAVLGDAARSSDPECRRLTDDRIAMLLALKKLHQTYKQTDKLRQVERQLKEAGYDK